MKLLILGGTRYLGLHLLAAAQARGHEVTLFNRGNYSTEGLGVVESIKGDRHSELDSTLKAGLDRDKERALLYKWHS